MQVPIEFVMHTDSAIDPSAFRQYAERRLTFALRRFDTRAERVTVRLADINGPKRGVDARCSITLRLRDGRRLDVQATTPWPFASVTRAAKRLNEALRRELERSQALRRPQRVA